MHENRALNLRASSHCVNDACRPITQRLEQRLRQATAASAHTIIERCGRERLSGAAPREGTCDKQVGQRHFGHSLSTATWEVARRAASHRPKGRGKDKVRCSMCCAMSS